MQAVVPTDGNLAEVQKDKLGLTQLVHGGEVRNGYLYLHPSREDTRYQAFFDSPSAEGLHQPHNRQKMKSVFLWASSILHRGRGQRR